MFSLFLWNLNFKGKFHSRADSTDENVSELWSFLYFFNAAQWNKKMEKMKARLVEMLDRMKDLNKSRHSSIKGEAIEWGEEIFER